MNRRRLTAVAVAAALAAGLGSAPVASADPTGGDADAVELRTVRDRYWACVAIDHVHIGVCVENPYPDLDGSRSVPDVLGDVLGTLEG